MSAFRRGGRLLYVGAGTSGRLGVLDASECPPTFRTSPNMVQGVIAGGTRALWQAVEGAEDDPVAGARAIQFRGVSGRDAVVGIAASGRTPFVWGALAEAKARRATTILICFNPHLVIPRRVRPSVVITPETGPEVLTGSTRLKCGTATKLILNIFTTLAMVRLGKISGNLMVDLNPSNKKLRERAIRILCELTGTDAEKARAALVKSNWVVKRARKKLNSRQRSYRNAYPRSTVNAMKCATPLESITIRIATRYKPKPLVCSGLKARATPWYNTETESRAPIAQQTQVGNGGKASSKRARIIGLMP